jgi:hypothetical protein
MLVRKQKKPPRIGDRSRLSNYNIKLIVRIWICP